MPKQFVGPVDQMGLHVAHGCFWSACVSIFRTAPELYLKRAGCCKSLFPKFGHAGGSYASHAIKN